MTTGAAASRPNNSPVLVVAAAGILLLTMGVRQSLGLFVLPIVAATGVSLVSVSFALAIGQFVWGAAQPLFGAVADHYGTYRVLIFGAVLLAAGALLAPWSATGYGFTLTLGVLLAAGTAAGSFAILVGVTASRFAGREPLARRGSHQCGRLARTALVRAAPATGLDQARGLGAPACSESRSRRF